MAGLSFVGYGCQQVAEIRLRGMFCWMAVYGIGGFMECELLLSFLELFFWLPVLGWTCSHIERSLPNLGANSIAFLQREFWILKMGISLQN